jgi:RHS repeat-associated protein
VITDVTLPDGRQYQCDIARTAKLRKRVPSRRNFRLPLLSIGGRGSAGYTMMLSLNTKSWHVKRTSMTTNGEEIVTYTPTPNTWQQAPEGTIYTTQQFDAMGRVKRSYNPYLTTSDGYADTAYDALGRITTVTTADGAVVGTTYSGNTVTVIDQAGKKRRSVTDGLGRLIRVDEPDSNGNLDTGTPPQPVQSTSYLYDVLDDLVKVSQGSQSRYFAYDSLKRLVRARNPEQDINASLIPALTDPVTLNSQWCFKYEYDEASNLLTKTDARSITTNYSYDKLNRVTDKSYGGDPQNTPAVAYVYDGQSLPSLPAGAPAFDRGSSTGRLVAVIYGANNTGTYQGYDKIGRVVQSIQVTDTQSSGSPTPQAYGFNCTYNLASEMLTETYPSGRILATEYDTAGRIAGVKRDATSYYAGAAATDTSRIQYAPQGAISAMKLGNGKWEHTTFNSRLQPSEIGLGASSGASDLLKLEYTYNSSDPNIHDDNGNVRTQRITAPKTSGGNLILTQTFTYDTLNRLQTATEDGSSWTQTYDCDRYGNRAVRNTSYIPAPSMGLTPLSANSTDFSAFNQGSNRLNNGIPAQVNIDYDSSGNLKKDAAARTMTYDAENRLLNFNGGAGQYFYDGDGHRVKKIDSSGATVFVYNVAGQLIAEYTSGPPPGGGTSYLTSDHLGSTRVVTSAADVNGNVTVKARYDYLPFGEEIGSDQGSRSLATGYVTTDKTRQKFTQKERDSESGLDYFGARYYSGAQGRFNSTDSYNPIVDSRKQEDFERYLAEPRNWNRYVYVWNNPFKYSDPSGEKVFVVTYTTGNSRDDEQLERAANTYAEELQQNRSVFNPETDTVIVMGVRSHQDLQKVFDVANSDAVSKAYGKWNK